VWDRDDAPLGQEVYVPGTVSDALTVDTTRGRINGYAAIAIVLAFWSVVFGRMWMREWRGERRSDSSHRG